MTMLAIVLAAAMMSGQPASVVSGPRFAQVMESLHAPLKDFAFIYEGTMRWTGPRHLLDGDPESFGEMFQGISVFRSDGAESLEVYVKRHDPGAVVRRKRMVLFAGNLDTVVYDQGTSGGRGNRIPRRAHGSPGMLNGPQSPHTLNHIPMLKWMLQDPDGWGYQCKGWENVGPHRCLVVEFNRNHSGSPDARDFTRLWVDLNRGGHPLQMEEYRDGSLASRVEDIELVRLPLGDGEHVWMPKHALVSGFEWGGVFHGRPVLQQSIDIVQGSMLVNVGVPDRFFSAGHAGGLPDVGSGAARDEGTGRLSLKDEFATQIVVEPQPIRTDPAGVRERVGELLAEADRQSQVLDASPGSRGFLSRAAIVQVSCAIAGTTLLLGALVWWYRRR